MRCPSLVNVTYRDVTGSQLVVLQRHVGGVVPVVLVQLRNMINGDSLPLNLLSRAPRIFVSRRIIGIDIRICKFAFAYRIVSITQNGSPSGPQDQYLSNFFQKYSKRFFRRFFGGRKDHHSRIPGDDDHCGHLDASRHSSAYRTAVGTAPRSGRQRDPRETLWAKKRLRSRENVGRKSSIQVQNVPTFCHVLMVITGI